MPACNNSTLCPGYMICEPQSPGWFGYIEVSCLSIFCTDYFARLLLCWTVPARFEFVIFAVVFACWCLNTCWDNISMSLSLSIDYVDVYHLIGTIQSMNLESILKMKKSYKNFSIVQNHPTLPGGLSFFISSL